MSAIMLSLRAAPPQGSPPGLWARWLSPVSVPRYWTAGAFAGCAVFAGAVALFSSNSLHQLWGLIAACSYVAAAAAVLIWRSRGVDLALVLSVCGALITPLFMNAASGKKQPEVSVIARSAKQLVSHQSPYASAAALAAVHDPNAYNPYLPVMSLFGIPRALFGSHVITDPRVWFGVAFLVVFWLALRAAGAGNAVRWTVFIAATPVIAFELAVGGTDIPILALLCLGFALLWRRPRFVLAGIALGLASAAKATAWPAVVVAAVLISTRDGRRPTLVFVGSALASCAAIVGPVAIIWPSALVANTILFPLGLADVKSAAASPLPGHAIADTGHTGHLIAVGLLVLAGVAIAASLVIRPPKTVPSAVWRLAIGLTLMFLLAPATRFGYFIYPASLVMWLEVSRFGLRRTATGADPPAGDEPRGRVAPAPSSA
jgi:4-amino-4-deoxy-L-arabinose transferase-like glycosyltransferase